MNDARLRELYDRALAERAVGTRASCPSPEALRALVAREGPESTRLATLDHAMSCPECRRELELLRAVSAGAPEQRRWRVSAPLALAASFLIVVAGGVIALRSMRAPGGDVMRGGGNGVALIAPSPDAPRVLGWHAVPGAISYVVEVLTSGGRVVAQAKTTDTTMALPDSVALTGGTHYLWWVRARRGDGTELQSPMQPLRGER
ncbi:MAG TPA: hypothetical protein VF041_00925 [Gemmatimonadaceae bacterium]